VDAHSSEKRSRIPPGAGSSARNPITHGKVRRNKKKKLGRVEREDWEKKEKESTGVGTTPQSGKTPFPRSKKKCVTGEANGTYQRRTGQIPRKIPWKGLNGKNKRSGKEECRRRNCFEQKKIAV